jgi:hypothetical protein
MGHTRLGKIPTTRAWRQVVGIFANATRPEATQDYSAEVARIASSTLEAAAGVIREAGRDGGLGYIFYLLTQLALAARRPQFREALADLGIQLPGTPTHFDLTIELHRAIDKHFLQIGSKSDVAEMAQQALGETLASYIRNQPRDLFAEASEQLQSDLRHLGTQNAFGQITRHFFANFMTRLLGFYVSKFVHPGPNQSLLADVADLTKFNDELRRHSFQRAFVVHDFAAKWFSKTEFEKGIDPQNSRSGLHPVPKTPS